MDKYVMANIRIPLKINEDGTFTTMNDNIEVSFSNYEGIVLAKSGSNDMKPSIELNNLISKLSSTLPRGEGEPEVFFSPQENKTLIPMMKILKSDIHSKESMPPRQHMTFKNQKKIKIETKKTLRTTTKSR
jgi:hypothetical protein